MDAAAILEAITGSGGALIVLALLVYVIVRAEILVPGKFYTAEVEKNQMLEAENEKLHKLHIENSVEIAQLRAEVEALRLTVRRLEGEGPGSRGYGR